MPGLNGRGPFGEGPRTGRGFGWCGGLGRRLRRRLGWGRFGMGRGRGRGWCGRFSGGRGWRAQANSPEEERRALLEEEARALKERLKEIEEELRS
ncbi:MAG: DUF5320 domain-containing protein [Thermodesulfobacteria bacterium]|nr:DUF5320 domain-containing protein [Thermodesulfobacteriota bacterium]